MKPELLPYGLLGAGHMELASRDEIGTENSLGSSQHGAANREQ